jgi:hypothetical protein
MPQLPSGKHFALNDYELRQMFLKLENGFRVHELMAIEKPEHLLPFVNVIYFKPSKDAMIYDNHEKSAKMPEGWQPYQSGFTLLTIRDELEQWPAEDRQAFAEFLSGAYYQDYLQSLLQDVEKVKSALLAEGPAIARVQAWWWKEGIHPLQPGGDDE